MNIRIPQRARLCFLLLLALLAPGTPPVHALETGFVKAREIVARRLNPPFHESHCSFSESPGWLKTAGGRVTGDAAPPGEDALLSRRGGFARQATGGLGGRLFIVRSAEDGDFPGTLRRAVRSIARSREPGWIVFSRRLNGAVIRLRGELRLPDNITLDGRCRNISLTAPANANILAIRSRRNIILTGLTLFKEGYDELGRSMRDAVSIMGDSDLIWIHRNRFRHCGDGCVDVASRTPPQRPLRVTISGNVFSNHNKVMLAGVLTCSLEPDLPECRAHHPAALGRLAKPLIYLTVADNVFHHTSQRHPKVYSRAYADVFANIFVLRATPYPDGRRSALYGVGVDKGGKAFVRRNVFMLAPGESRAAAVYDIGTGCVSMQGNLFAPGVAPVLRKGEPCAVRAPGYPEPISGME